MLGAFGYRFWSVSVVCSSLVQVLSCYICKFRFVCFSVCCFLDNFLCTGSTLRPVFLEGFVGRLLRGSSICVYNLCKPLHIKIIAVLDLCFTRIKKG